MKIRVAAILLGMVAVVPMSLPAKPKARVPAPLSFVISMAHSYELSGRYRFQTLFTDVESVSSPNVTGSVSDGQVVFQPKGVGHSGGSMQITFISVNTQFHFECDGGNGAQLFELLISGYDAGGALRKTAHANGAGRLVFDTPAMKAKADLTVIVTSQTSTRQWSMDRCDVTPAA